MHIADYQAGDSFYEVTFNLDTKQWEFSETRPEWFGTVTSFFDHSDDLLMCIRIECPPIFELQVRKEILNGEQHQPHPAGEAGKRD